MHRFPVVLNMVRAIYEAGKPVGGIYHVGWVLISVGILEGKTTVIPFLLAKIILPRAKKSA